MLTREINVQGELYQVILDDEVYEQLKEASLYGQFDDMTQKVYVHLRFKGKGEKQIYLHRWLMNAPKGMVVDHKNDNPLDNRRSNLQIITHAQNLQKKKPGSNNKSGVRGIYQDKKSGNWKVEFWRSDKRIYVGTFSDFMDACDALNEAKENLSTNPNEMGN